jgi:Ca-activated chloride channel family protein
MTKNKGMGLQADFDRQLIHWRGDSVRYLVLTLQAPEKEQTTEEKRAPLNVGLVVDASGSMSGDRIASAKQAAEGVVECLHDGDYLSLVSFDTTSSVHVRGQVLEPESRRQIIQTIQNIHAGATTNLSGGWLEGAECVAEVQQNNAEFHNRVLLLSDGHANVGVEDPHALHSMASGLRDRGITSSSVGIGDGYATTQIQAIADGGGGLMHDAEHPSEIVEVVMGEFSSMLSTFAEDIILSLSLPRGLRVEQVGKSALRESTEGTAVRIGSLLHGRSRQIILRIFFSGGAKESVLQLNTQASWQLVGSAERQAADFKVPILTYVSGSECGHQGRNIELSRLVAERWQMQVLSEAVDLNRDGAYHEAQGLVKQQLKYLRRYCKGLSGTGQLIRDLERVVQRVQQPMHERARKDVQLHAYQEHMEMGDYRAAPRPDWQERMFDE